jgi:lipoprotein-anchoring transpeptidase ErfK/SrfK
MKKVIFFLVLILFLVSVKTTLGASPVDTDKDGLVDIQEEQFKTNPNHPDTDNDGFVDGLEIRNGFDPLSSEAKKLHKTILIDLKKQELYQQLNGVTIRTHTVSTGKPSMPTPKGEYVIGNKSERAWSKTYGLWMPFWLGLKGTRMGIHELPEWPGGYKEGAAHLGQAVSHGCIRLGIKAAEIVYTWTDIGTKVIVK